MYRLTESVIKIKYAHESLFFNDYVIGRQIGCVQSDRYDRGLGAQYDGGLAGCAGGLAGCAGVFIITYDRYLSPAIALLEFQGLEGFSRQHNTDVNVTLVDRYIFACDPLYTLLK